MQRKKGKEPLREAVKRLDEKLGHQLEQVWRLAEEGIHDGQTSKDGHQQGTPHCRAVEENLAVLIPDDWKETRLTVTDLFVLSVAAVQKTAGVPIGVAPAFRPFRHAPPRDGRADRQDEEDKDRNGAQFEKSYHHALPIALGRDRWAGLSGLVAAGNWVKTWSIRFLSN